MVRMPLNNGFEYLEQIGPDAEDQALADYLVRRYAHSSKEEWEARVREGRVLLDGIPIAATAALRRGQILTWSRPPWEEPAAPRSFEVLFDDGDLLAAAKPAGLPTLPGAGFHQATLLELVRQRAPGAAPLHRLGRWTSGIVLFARSQESRAALTRQWTAHEVRKVYRALASGSPARNTFIVESPIGRVPHSLLGSVHAATPGGKAARSEVSVLERREESFLCEVRIDSGRPHQIRIHLAVAGHPLAGDPLYISGGGIAPDARAVPGDPGYLLHATELTFRHPRDGCTVTIASDPPEALRVGAR